MREKGRNPDGTLAAAAHYRCMWVEITTAPKVFISVGNVMPPLSLKSTNNRKRVARLEKLAGTLDTKFSLFGVPFGWDAIAGLIPGLGAATTFLPGAVMIVEGARMGARKRVLARMALVTGADLLIGGIPIVGDVFDVYFRSHLRSVALLKVDLARKEIDESLRKEIDAGGSHALGVHSDDAVDSDDATVRYRRTVFELP